MNRIITRSDIPSIPELFKPYSAGLAVSWDGWTVLPDGLLDGFGVPVEKTAGTITRATPQSIPSARRRMIRELVTAQPSFCLPSLSLLQEYRGCCPA